MRNVYQFSIFTGASKEFGPKLSFVQNLGFPLDVTAISKPYYDENECITACIHFLNRQNKNLPEHYKTAIEPNPFLSGASGDMTEEELEYNAARWSDSEIMKIISYAPAPAEIPIQCSIYKTPSSDGTRINGTETHN